MINLLRVCYVVAYFVKLMSFRIKKFGTALPLLLFFSLSVNKLNAQTGEQWYYYTSDKLNMHVYEFGKGDTTLVLHGGFGAEHSYLIEALQPLQNNFHFFLFDQRGSLRSPAPDSLLTFNGLVEDVEELRKELKLEKVSLLAHSMGTRIAMEYTQLHPERVKNLVLLSSILPVSDTSYISEYASFYLENRDEVIAERKNLQLPENKDYWTSKMYTHSWRISFASVNTFNIKNWRKIQGGVAFFNQRTANLVYSTAPAEWNYVPVLKQYSIPLTVVNGEYDYLNFSAKDFNYLLSFYTQKKNKPVAKIIEEKGVTSLSALVKHQQWKEFETTIPTLKVYTVAKAGHRIWMDDPKHFKKFIQEAFKNKSK